MQLNTPQLKVLASKLFHHFRMLDGDKPADEMIIPIGMIRPDKKEKNTFYATIKYEVNYCGLKKHEVRVKFNTDDHGALVTKSCQYA